MSIRTVFETVAEAAEEAAGEADLFSFFDKLFDKLSSDLLKIFQQENVDEDLKTWSLTLQKIRAVLAVAEEKQITDGFVKSWLAELEDLAYDVDDILDEFATEALRRELNPEPNKSKMRKIFDACVGSNRNFVKLMRSKIEDIDTRLQNIMNDKKDLELTENTGVRTITTRSRVPATSLVESHTYGREKDKEAIVKLLSDESSGAQLSTISILGMGGLGKTTLAQLIYNDDKVGSYFDVKAWGCVSQDFDILSVTKEILQDITSETCNDDSLNLVQRKLKEQLSGKKFLLILDDVWIENYSDWTKLRLPFESGAPGSKILITTRDANVSSTMGATHPYKLRELSNDACLTMFTQHALGTSDFGEHLKVEDRQKILERCKGLPLAAKALAGLLRTYDRDEWKDVLNGRIWDLLEEKTDVPSTLRLSYLCLPSSLKKCFAYCSLFPKDYNFVEKELVLLWMAEGMIRETREKSMEDLGGEYFNDLLKRSFFQQSSINESLFLMHDLMHDLAQWAAGDLCCRLEDQLDGSKISTKVRHFSYITSSYYFFGKFDDFPKDMHLRTFLLLPLNCTMSPSYFDAIYWLLPQLRYLRVLSFSGCLRVLSFSGYRIFELPSSIGDLKHLRYLNFSYLGITSLPESTCSLYNLQTLILKDCSNLTKLPEKIENLVNLRHLDITNANSIIEMPVGIAKLKSLRTLTNFVVGKDKIVDLMNMESLQGTLCISHLENMLDATKVNLKGKKNLDTLVMKWDDDLQDAEVATNILNMLRPHGTIKTLFIQGYIGAIFPTWLGDPSFSNMVDLRIERSGKCMFLPAFGQLPSLKRLIIKKMDRVQSVGLEFYGELCVQPFRSLEKLCFEDMPEWQDWSPNLTSLSSRDTLPTTLKVLKLVDCPKLESIVDELNMDTSLEEFSIICCEKLRCLPRGQLCHLKKITIHNCKSLISLEDSIPTNLRSLEIEDCENLVALPNDMRLYSLQTLSVCNCPRIVFKDFPSDLRELRLSGANLCEQVFELGLHRLTSLTSLEIANGEEDGKTILMLPNSLTTLSFENFPNLLFLYWKFFQNHSTLEQIFIRACPKFESLSAECFPPSLQLIHIYECPVLKQNYEKDEGIMWSQIAHIRSVIIDGVEQQK